MEPKTQFYTYLWLREDGTPYYVGKGKGRRAYRGEAHGVHCPPNPVNIIVQEFERESDALFSEVFLIEFYGRQDLGTGCLRNRTKGGDGQSGLVHTEATKQKMRESHLRNKVKEHHLHTDETKRRMSELQKIMQTEKPRERDTHGCYA
jgi:hypothetical protein